MLTASQGTPIFEGSSQQPVSDAGSGLAGGASTQSGATRSKTSSENAAEDAIDSEIALVIAIAFFIAIFSFTLHEPETSCDSRHLVDPTEATIKPTRRLGWRADGFPIFRR